MCCCNTTYKFILGIYVFRLSRINTERMSSYVHMDCQNFYGIRWPDSCISSIPDLMMCTIMILKGIVG